MISRYHYSIPFFGFALLTLFVSLQIPVSYAQNKLSLPIPEPLDQEFERHAIGENQLDGKSYWELEELRSAHSKVMNQLVKDGKVRENIQGTIDLLAVLDVDQMGAVKSENRIRSKMFEMIGDQENRSARAIAREFYEARAAELGNSSFKNTNVNKEPVPANIAPALSIAAAPSVPDTLVTQFAEGFLKSLGYGKFSSVRRNQSEFFVGRRSFGKGFVAVESLSGVPESGAGEQNGLVTFESGRVAGQTPKGVIALEGLAVVVSEDNPVEQITMSDVADIFSGKINSWEDLPGGSDDPISIHLPGNNSGALNLLDLLVMKPYEAKLSLPRSTTASGDLTELKSNPSVIGICSTSAIPAGVKALKIRAGDDSVPLAPTLANIISLDYPMISYLRVQTIGDAGRFTKEFIDFVRNPHGQKIVNGAGFEGTNWIADGRETEVEQQREALLSSKAISSDYKKIIQTATRKNTPANFRFVPGSKSFELTDYSKSQFDRLVRYLKQTGKDQSVILMGFADSEGQAYANKVYSKKRSDSVADRLRAEGITNVKSVGIGEEVPVGNNRTENGRAANRRVEVWIAAK